MPKTILDAKVGLSVNPDDYFNEVHTIHTLRIGLGTIAQQIKGREQEWQKKTAENVKVQMFGIDIDGSKNNLDIIVCLFHWFGVSLCNYVRLIGFIRGLEVGDFDRADLTDEGSFNTVKKSVNDYVRDVSEMSAVRKWRNKVGAHFAITSPRTGDNKATLDMSVMHPVTFSNGRYRVAELALIYRDGTRSAQTSDIQTWSVTEVFEALIPRYWPHVRIQQ